MITLYMWNADNVYSGSTEIENEFDPVPSRSTMKVPPETEGTQVVMWNGEEWVLADQLPNPPEPVELVPVEVTMRQARLALLEANILDSANNAIAAMEGKEGTVARIEWEFSSTMRRDSPFVASIGTALSLSEAQIDELFIYAGKL